MTLVNCEIEFDLSWSKNWIISKIFNTPEIDANPAAIPSIEHIPATSTTSSLF